MCLVELPMQVLLIGGLNVKCQGQIVIGTKPSACLMALMTKVMICILQVEVRA